MKRREFIALLTAVIGAPTVALSKTLTLAKPIDDWAMTHDRVFLGGGFWANPMEDWRIQDGWAVCQNSGGGRNIQSLLYELTDAGKPFTVSVEVKRPEKLAKDGGAGFRIGVTADIDDHRAAVFAGNGYRVGIINGDSLVIAQKVSKLTAPLPTHVTLMLVGQPDGQRTKLTLSAVNPENNEVIGSLTHSLQSDVLQGNIALASQFSGPKGRPKPAGYAFRNWQISGDAFAHFPERAFGPVLWSMYSLSDNRNDDGFVMKLTAMMGPMGEKDNQTVGLAIKRNGKWQQIATAELDLESSIATFRLPKWDASKATPYRVTYAETLTDGKTKPHEWAGTIRANPTKPLRMGGLTCQNAVGFPYKPVADNLVNLDLDLLFFSGDQLYESHGGFGVIRNEADMAILNYLRKFYMFGWAFREAMANAPTICIPDDHDVFHGNIWGEAGAKMEGGNTSTSGGYIQPAKMVNVVHRTNCSHHPDFASPRPVKQDISVYYGDMVYGNVGFAIIADRQWKSGPDQIGQPQQGRAHRPRQATPPSTPQDLRPAGAGPARRAAGSVPRRSWAEGLDAATSMKVAAQPDRLRRRRDAPRPARRLPRRRPGLGRLAPDAHATGRSRSSARPWPLHICGDQHLASAWCSTAWRNSATASGPSAPPPSAWVTSAGGAPTRSACPTTNRPDTRHGPTPASTSTAWATRCLHLHRRQPRRRTFATAAATATTTPTARCSGFGLVDHRQAEAKTYLLAVLQASSATRPTARTTTSIPRLADHDPPGREQGREPDQLVPLISQYQQQPMPFEHGVVD